jgi:hypothetical protein
MLFLVSIPFTPLNAFPLMEMIRLSPYTWVSDLQKEVLISFSFAMYVQQRVAIPHAGWNGPPGTAAGTIVKKTQRIEVPVDKYPNFNFVGRILGPRGNSLKRVEATTGCRVLIRGQGSIKDTAKVSFSSHG